MQVIKKAGKLGVVALLVLSTSAMASLTLAQDQDLRKADPAYPGSQADLGHMGDQASSVKNNDGSRAWMLYENDNFGGRQLCIPPNTTINDLHDDKWDFGDKISSVKRLAGKSCN